MSSTTEKSKRHHRHRKIQARVAVVGGGIAGMAAAARLAVSGCQVVLFEANDILGGKLNDRHSAGFRFDCGPSLFTLPETLEALFSDCGKNLKDYLQYDKLDLITRYHYSKGNYVDAWADQEKLGVELYDKFNEDPAKVRKYFKRIKWIYILTTPVFLQKSIGPYQIYLNYSPCLLRVFFGVCTSSIVRPSTKSVRLNCFPVWPPTTAPIPTKPPERLR